MVDPNQAAGAIYGLAGLKVAVTGAGSGIGAETSRLVAKLGATLALLDINVAAIDAIASDISNASTKPITIALDLADESSVTRAFETAAQKLSGLNAVIHVAGIYPRTGLFDTDLAVWDKVQDINARGTLLVIRESARLMLAAGKGGRIVNISSMSAVRVPQDNQHAYCASKAAVNSLTRTAAYELAPKGILVNAIMPGVSLSERAQKVIESDVATRTGILQPGRIRIDRWGTPADIAGVAAFLISPAAGYICGQCIAVDGGYEIS